MKALVGAFNQEKALVGAFSVIVQPVVEPMEHYTALEINCAGLRAGMVEAEQVAAPGDGGRFRLNSALSSLTSSARGAGTDAPRRTDTLPSSKLENISIQ